VVQSASVARRVFGDTWWNAEDPVGHKTASVYRRYRIVAEDDLREALARMQASLATRQSGTVTLLRETAPRAGR
jgi:hypothetical protein